MKTKKLLVGFLALIMTITITGCATKKESESKSSNAKYQDTDSNKKSGESINSQQSETPSQTKSYIKMEISSMNDGKKTQYDVDNYARGGGAAGMSNHYYYVKDNELYYVSAAEPETTKKIATGIHYVIWDNEKAFIAIADQNADIIEKEASYLSYAYTNISGTLRVNSMNNDNKIKEYLTDNYARGGGAAGMSNHYYYVKNRILYYVSAADPEKSTPIASGVIYITFSPDSRISGFLAFTGSDFKYINEDAAYLLKTISF